MHRAIVGLLAVLLLGTAAAAGGVTAQAASSGEIAAEGPSVVMADQPATLTSAAELNCDYEIEVEDNTGETITIEEEPEEIVILAPNVAQHVWELGAQEKVTGMPDNPFTEYLEGSDDRTDVVDEMGEPINEEVVDLEADLVLAPNVISQDSVDALREADQVVYHYQPANDMETMLTIVERTGELVGACEEAESLTTDLADRIEFVEQALADVDEERVFYDLGDDPVGPFTVSEGSLEHDVITTAGTENIAADVGEGPYPEVDPEFVLDENPEVVIAPGPLSDFAGYEETDALANDRVIEVDGNFISQHGPRNVDVLEALADEIHPEAMEQARDAEDDADETDEDETDDETDDETEDDEAEDDVEVIQEDDDEDDADDADDDGVGFTVVAVVAGLSALLIGARYWN